MRSVSLLLFLVCTSMTYPCAEFPPVTSVLTYCEPEVLKRKYANLQNTRSDSERARTGRVCRCTYLILVRTSRIFIVFNSEFTH
jgi:hypothetical protein